MATTGGSEATAPRAGKKGKQDTAETVTPGAPQDALPESAGPVTASATSEACLPAGDSCARDRQCCSRKCTGKNVCKCNDASPCPANKTCQNGQCLCPDGTKLCNGACIPSSDCCGNADCPSGQVCDGGTCVGGCQAEDRQTTCGQDGCGQKTNNCDQPVDCGGCGSGASCVNGRCEADCLAEDPQTTCGARGCGQKTNNCGQSVACGGCGQDASCVEGRCEAISCVPEDPQTTCAGLACGTRTNNCSQDVDCGGCPSGQDCKAGECVTAAPVCGNGQCESGETCSSCPADCGPCPAVCGNGTCEAGETCSTCPADCGQCTGGIECTTDADCVPGACCHPGYCVPAAQAPVCDGFACEANCQEYTLDCGQGYCACQNGICFASYDFN